MLEISPLDASEIVETAETGAWWALTDAVPAEMTRRLGLSIHRHGDVTVATCRLFDDFVGNRAFGLHPAVRCSTSTLSEIVACYRSHGLRNYALQISPMARPRHLSAWLNDNGFECRNRWAVVLRNNQMPADVHWPHEIRRIGSDEEKAFVETTGGAFGWPKIRARWMAATVGHRGWHHYLAYAGGSPIAAGALFVADEVGWLGMAATLARHRRHGAHDALLNRRIRDAIQMGCRWIVAETGEANPSYRHLLKAGFELVYWRDNYCEKPGVTAPFRDFTLNLREKWACVVRSATSTRGRSA